ncbi:MAG: hypothetical protein WD342_19395 [Verrucomicrobiales bacterium]
MIALPHAMPFIRIGSSSLALCQPDWLSETLANAANGTDLPSWMAEDISRGVESFLKNHYQGSVIEPDELFGRIERTLSSLGLEHVAENMDKKLPPVRISLNELARRAGSGYELAFFRLLDDQLRSAAFGGATSVELHGLENCVRRLSASKRWSSRCERLKVEITDFLGEMRERVVSARPDLAILIVR